MRLGGFVIHGNNAAIIQPCLDSLSSVCDRLVAIDTGSSDGTAALATQRGFSVLRRPWEGFGAARAAAVDALEDCDWVLFLDTDEWLGAEARLAIQRVKAAPSPVPRLALPRRNWAELGAGPFVYQYEHPVRLVRRDHARFSRRQIVHEAVPPGPTRSLDAVIEHRYVTSVEDLRSKLGRYALLWALRNELENKAVRSPTLAWAIHLARDLVLRRAALTGRAEAFGIAAALADYHAWKFAFLREVRAGAFATLSGLLHQDRLEELFQALPDFVDPELKPWAPWLSWRSDRTA